jgi:hypothetical protein
VKRLLIALVCISACSAGAKVKQDVVVAGSSAIDCLKQEATAIKKGEGWIGLALSIAEQLGATLVTGGDPLALVASLVSQYGEPVVACVMHEIATGGPAGAGSAAGPATGAKAQKSLAAAHVIEAKGWTFAPKH